MNAPLRKNDDPGLKSGSLRDEAGAPTIDDQPMPSVAAEESLLTGLNAGADDPSAAFGPGALVKERYQLEKVLGRGGMGVVYLATDQHLHRPVALKVIRPP